MSAAPPQVFVPASTPETEPFWQGCRDGELRMQRCADCERFYFVPRSFCPRCWGDQVRWLPLSGSGTLASYVIAARSIPGVYERAPYAVALVDLEEGVRMMSNLVGLELSRAALPLGLPLQVCFEPRGALRIPVFEPRAGP